MCKSWERVSVNNDRPSERNWSFAPEGLSVRQLLMDSEFH
jgi:hypothetical protein